MKKFSTLIILGFILTVVAGCTKAVPSVHKENNKNATGNINSKVEPEDPKIVGSGNHYFDNADSVWLDGNWTDVSTGLYGDRYVITFMGTGSNGKITDPNQPQVVVLNWGRTTSKSGNRWVNYNCPKDIGHLEITNITDDGNVVRFKSLEGTSGTLNLITGQWRFK